MKHCHNTKIINFMIKKIKKIKNLGIFSDYKWDEESLNDFQRFNLIYGWNGSGKTTLTKLFSALGDGASKEFADLEYEVEAETGVFKTGPNFDKKIRVFNQDYIENNIEISGSRARPIYVLGAENKVIAEKILKDEALLKEMMEKKSKEEGSKGKKDVEKGKKFTDVAKIIGANTSGSSLRNYRKPDAEKAFALLAYKKLLKEEDVNKCLIILKQEEKSGIPEISVLSFGQLKNILVGQCKSFCLQTVSSSIIARLRDNPDVSRWVEAGLRLHQGHNSVKCEFCNQSLPTDRIKELVGYFNEEDKKLKDSIDGIINRLNEIATSIKSLYLVDKANFYVELQTEYTSQVTTLNKERINLLASISELIEKLQDKKTRTTEKIDLEFNFNDKFEKSIEGINQVIGKHNEKSANFQAQRDATQKSLENHYLSEIFDDVKKIEADIVKCDGAIKMLNYGDANNLGIEKLSSQISKNKSTISSEHKACEMFNGKLETFLGRKEIIFEVSSPGGYIIKRNGKVAINLSEGEKTAIAFIYFVVHLEDRDFVLGDGIVVIDDPISSLDSNSLFQAFSFLKNSVENAKQVFILTHNFDFLRLIINWLNHVCGKKNRPYFMIGNNFVGSERVAEIKQLDELLTNHESEYHYLCKILFDLEIDDKIATVYNIPNIARKVLETFLMFRVPNSDSTHEKLKLLDFDEVKKTAIYKFTNDKSHITGKGFDPSLIPETQKNVKYLLDMMEKVFPDHFTILKSSIKP
jgi:wobble nucleotide-excising tRNase